MKEFLIGSLKGGDAKKSDSTGSSTAVKSNSKSEGGGLSPLAIIFLLVAIVLGVYFTQTQK